MGAYQVAVVPSIGLSPYLPALLEHLADVVSYTMVVDNGEQPSPQLRHWCQHARGRVQLQHQPGQNLYATWNAGMDAAMVGGSASSVPVCHVLNDDVVLYGAELRRMAWELATGEYAVLGYDYSAAPGAMDVEDVWVEDAHGTYRRGGVGGFAFAVRADRCARADTRFRWWGGDDDLVYATAQAGGKVGVLRGCGVAHPEPSYSASRAPRTDDWAERDRELMLAKWGEAW